MWGDEGRCGATRGGYIRNVTIDNVTIYGVLKKSVWAMLWQWSVSVFAMHRKRQRISGNLNSLKTV